MSGEAMASPHHGRSSLRCLPGPLDDNQLVEQLRRRRGLGLCQFDPSAHHLHEA